MTLAKAFLLVAAAGLLFLPSGVAAPNNAGHNTPGQKRTGSKKTASAPSLKSVHRAIGKEEYAKAKRQADALLKAARPAHRKALVRAYGRILLGLGQTDNARDYLQKMAAARLQGDDLQLMKVYAAWLEAENGNVERAVDFLQTLVRADDGSLAAAEAADVLAIICLQQNDREKAKMAVSRGLYILDYYKLDSPYHAALLRGRLTSKWGQKKADDGAAQKLYEQAEALRTQLKFRAAGKLHAQLRAQFSGSTWRHPAGFRIGQCLVGLKLYDRAESHWAGLVSADPAGPWRGQVQLGRIDLALEIHFDLAAAAKLVEDAVAVLHRGTPVEAESSWNRAAVELRLREGMLALVEKRYDGALSAFRAADSASAAQQGTENDRLRRRIQRLAELTRQSQDLVPPSLDDAHPRVSQACALGGVNLLLGRYERAKRFYNRVLTGQTRSGSPAHLSFAALGMARVYRAQGDLVMAKRGYQFSLQQDAVGSWHDETLRDLALLIEQMAADKFGTTAAIDAEGQPVASAQPAHSNQGPRRLKSKQWINARAAALPYWTRLLQAFPHSRHLPQALFCAGVLHAEINRPDLAEYAFEQLTLNHPDSAWTGDAHVRLIDVKLERHFDLAGARRHAKAAVAWLKNRDERLVAKARGGLGAESGAGKPRSLREICYAIYVRSGVVEYLDQQYGQARAMFENAQRFEPSRSFEVVAGSVPTAIERLIAAAKNGQPLTPESVLEGDESAKLMLMLADLYYEGQEYEIAMDLCTRVLRGEATSGTDAQTSWAHFRRARCHYCLEESAPGTARRDVVAARQDYLAAHRAAPTADWADNALFLAANIYWNNDQDIERARSLWQHVLSNYPQSDERERVTYFIGTSLVAQHRYQDALQFYEELERDSLSAALIRMIEDDKRVIQKELNSN